jgi:MFS family permease
VTVAIVGLTLDELAAMVGMQSGVDLRQIFLARGLGAVVGTLVGGWMVDRLPIKQVIVFFVVMSAATLGALVPNMPGARSLAAAFFLVGLSGSALVVCATTSACWAFPGASVGPVMSRASASFGVSSAALPLIMHPLSASLRLQYGVCAACSLPALLLLSASNAPARPIAPPRPPPSSAAVDEEKRSHGARRSRRGLALALAAALVQVLLQGGLSSLMGWIVSFGRIHYWYEADRASVLMSVLQGASTVGCMLAAEFQRRVDLLLLLPAQLAVATAGMLVCIAWADSSVAGFAAIAWYGFFAGPTVGYCSSLLNTYATLTGIKMSIVSLGINAGANLVPWAVGCLMSSLGPLALVGSICAANIVLIVVTSGAACATTWAPRGSPDRGRDEEAGSRREPLLPETEPRED